MSFKARLTLVAAAAVALAVLVASAVVWLVVRDQLYGQVDSSLQNRAALVSSRPIHVSRMPDGRPFLEIPPDVLGEGGYIQAVRADGNTFRSFLDVAIPVTPRTLEVARGEDGAFFTDAVVNDEKERVLTVPYGPRVALQVSQPLGSVQHTLGRITLLLLLVAAGGIAVAAGLGLAVSRAALAPVRKLTNVAESVTETGDLSTRISTPGRDELGRLASSFNTMLAALEVSTNAQRQLVADASHELRTPLTSLRTNIEVLSKEDRLPPAERERLLKDVVQQLDEMTALVAGLIELAHGEQHPAESEDVRLDLVAEQEIERARRARSGLVFTADLQESLVHGVPRTIERAVGNLLDNAAKWSPPGGEVEISVRRGEVTVRDHGPGIDDKDLPYVFDRFYRAPSARGMPGSGLGLAIVKQVAEAHGGTVVAERAEGGGTRMILRLNGRAPEPS